jgi:hypothetical protein
MTIRRTVYFQPPLTTVAQDFNVLGKRAVELLIQLMAAPQMKIRELLPTRLIIRHSTWPCAGAGRRRKRVLSRRSKRWWKSCKQRSV